MEPDCVFNLALYLKTPAGAGHEPRHACFESGIPRRTCLGNSIPMPRLLNCFIRLPRRFSSGFGDITEMYHSGAQGADELHPLIDPHNLAGIFLHAPTRSDPEFVPLTPFMIHVWRMHGLPNDGALEQNRDRERFVYSFYDTFHQTRAPYRLPAPPNTLQWLNQPALDVSSAFEAQGATLAGQKYYLTRYMRHIWQQTRRDVDPFQADGYLRFLTWFAVECIPAWNLPPLLLPNELLPLLNRPIRPPLPLTEAMRFLGERRGVLATSDLHSAPDEYIAAISFHVLPDLLKANDPRLVPEVLSHFWSAKLSADPEALTAYEYFAARACCPGLVPASALQPNSCDAIRRWCGTEFRAVIPEAVPFFSMPPAVPQDDDRRASFDSPNKAIFIYRDHQTIAGLSRAGLATEMALGRAGFETINLDFSFRRTRLAQEFTHNQQLERRARSALHILNLNPEYVPECLMCHLSLLDKRSYIIGQFYWELSETSAIHECGLSAVHEIWVASEYLRDVYRRRVSVPICVMGQAIDLPVSEGQFTRTDFNLPKDSYTFIFSFDAGSVVERKNPLATVQAFRKAFPAGTERAILVLKTRNLDTVQTNRDQEHWSHVLEIAAADPRIQIVDRTMSSAELTGLISACDSYISLHRSEGFGYGPAEAMGLGKPVITTAYSGVLDFCTPKTALLVDYKIQRVSRGAYPYMDEARDYYWAAPDVDHAALQMRNLYKNPQAGQMIGKCGQELIQKHYSLDALQRRYVARLTELGWS